MKWRKVVLLPCCIAAVRFAAADVQAGKVEHAGEVGPVLGGEECGS